MRKTEEILAERQKTHGDFGTHSRMAQALKKVVRDSGQRMDEVQAEGMEMILHKVARILNGNANHQDHWDDIAGYAVLVSRHMQVRRSVS